MSVTELNISAKLLNELSIINDVCILCIIGNILELLSIALLLTSVPLLLISVVLLLISVFDLP